LKAVKPDIIEKLNRELEQDTEGALGKAKKAAK
jgi:hypothetical protein